MNKPKKWCDYEQCCVAGHNEHNCERNIVSRAKFEEHNKCIDDHNEWLKSIDWEEIINTVLDDNDRSCNICDFYPEILEQIANAIKERLQI